MQELFQFLRHESSNLRTAFAQASISGEGTPQEVADFREGAFHRFIERFFPFPHRVTKGVIRDTSGTTSASVDCVVCNPNHPYTVDTKNKFQLLFAEGVDVAIEVKPDLAKTSELVTALTQGLTVKALRRHTTPTLSRVPWIEERSRRVPFVVFGMRCKADPLDTGREIAQYYRDHETAPLDQADFVVVNDVGIFSNWLDPAHFRWQGVGPQTDKTGWFFEGWGPDSLAGMLWHMHDLAFASIKQIEDVLPPYLRSASGIKTLVKI